MFCDGSIVVDVGLPWTMYTWYMTLSTAHIMQRKPIVQSLLRDFNSISRADNDTCILTDSCLPLLFDIFRESKVRHHSCFTVVGWGQYIRIFQLLNYPLGINKRFD